MKPQLHIPFVILFIVFLTNCQPDANRNQPDHSGYENGTYDYYVYESTGDNQFIKVKDKEIKIQFNRDESDRNSLQDLDNLNWTVLYLSLIHI